MKLIVATKQQQEQLFITVETEILAVVKAGRGCSRQKKKNEWYAGSIDEA